MSPRPGTWREEARRLRGTANCAQIAERLGVHPETIRRFFEQDRGESRIVIHSNVPGDDRPFIEPHVYRTPRKIDMGPVVKEAWAAVEQRRASA